MNGLKLKSVGLHYSNGNKKMTKASTLLEDSQVVRTVMHTFVFL